MMTIWFTSDTHFYHKAIIGYCNRPANDVEEMNELLISNWNSKVAPDDEIYHLGDFAFAGNGKKRAIIERLNGKKCLVRGNHDGSRKEWYMDAGFQWVRDYYVLKVHDKRINEEGEEQQFHVPIVLCHFPILSWDGMAHGSWHLHGHCHGSLPPTGMRRFDVGVDTNNLMPYSYEDIKKIMVWRGIVPVGHHGL